ncbi:MAG: Holliday junction branch migration protein RuvA [Christensenellaceae bacterium]|jgi:Holliday junction DNA helicase RuvA|nr:Holliday junction branch migration protein RuvA [Christensenellaceae bacterium]
MLSYIKGTLAHVTTGVAVVDVHGIGYELTISYSTLTRISTSVGSEVKLYTSLIVRDDGMSLFGFYSQEEKTMFSRLITVSGIGPKLAISVLSGIELPTLALAIASGDAKKLSSIKGVGKKTAERIVLELKEKLTQADASSVELSQITSSGLGGSMIEDAITALRSLGVSQVEALTAINAVNAQATYHSLEELILATLKFFHANSSQK